MTLLSSIDTSIERRAVRFPCERFPTDRHEARLLGVYDMRPAEFVMQRIRVPGGRIGLPAWRAVAELVRRYTPGYPLHVTTRQDIELHGLRPEDVPAVQRGVQAAGLSTLGACGDTTRNITACPVADCCVGTVDLAALGAQIQSSLDRLPWRHDLPRKFKISLSGCARACARPWINDIGLIAQSDGTFQAIAAGSLGARPGLGMLLYERLHREEVIPFVVAVLRLFHAEGQRESRARARLRHLRERLGDEQFREKVDQFFREEAASGEWPAVALLPSSRHGKRLARLHLPLGDIEADLALELADALQRVGASLCIGFDHDLFVYGTVEPTWSPALERLTRGPSLVACAGAAMCPLGIADSRQAGRRLLEVLPPDLGLTVNVSGCPNACPQSPVADIGLIGCRKTVHGQRQECFRLVAGGGNGSTPRLAEELHPAVPASQVADVVRYLADRYRSSRRPGEAFGDFVRREKAELAAAVQTLTDTPVAQPL